MINQCRMGKAIACPSIQRDAIDGHVVPPLPILREEYAGRLHFYIKAIDEQLYVGWAKGLYPCPSIQRVGDV